MEFLGVEIIEISQREEEIAPVVRAGLLVQKLERAGGIAAKPLLEIKAMQNEARGVALPIVERAAVDLHVGMTRGGPGRADGRGATGQRHEGEAGEAGRQRAREAVPTWRVRIHERGLVQINGWKITEISQDRRSTASP